MAGTITYPYLRDKVCDLRAASYDDLTASEKKRLAAWITKAYRYAWEELDWKEANDTNSYAVVDGKVTGLAASDFATLRAFDADPRPASAVAQELRVDSVDADGVWLATKLTTVWLKLKPRPPVFTFESDETATLLWMLEEVTCALALSYWFSSEQEHEQAARFAAEAETLLTQLERREGNNW